MKRELWIDSFKGILILLVVLGHSIQFFLGDSCYENHWWNLIYSFHMPAFIAISGFLQYGKKTVAMGGVKRYIQRRFFQLIVPFLMWTILWVCIKPQGEFFPDLASRLFYPSRGFWFLWVLWVICCLFYLLNYISEKFKMAFIFPIVFVALFLLGLTAVVNTKFLALHLISLYFPIYAVGYYARGFLQMEIFTRNRMILILGVAWCLLALYWNMNHVPFFMKSMTSVLPENVMLFGYRFATATTAIYFFMALSRKAFINGGLVVDCLAKLGEISLGVYTAHMILGSVINKQILVYLDLSTNMSILISFVVLSLLSVIIVNLINKINFLSKTLLGKI